MDKYLINSTLVYRVPTVEDALKLRDMGNPIRDAVPNAKNLGLVVYLFEKTEKLKSDMDEIFKK